MRRISKKLLIGIIAMLVLSATAFAALTFSLADDAGEESNTGVYAANGPVTMIDYIIENAISSDSTDPVYHILELGSSDTPSDLQTLVSSGGFREYVINGNKSEGYTGTMPDTADIEYLYYNATEGNLKKVNADGSTSAATDEEIVNAIQKADLCYLSNDPSGNGGAVFKKGNDITEAIKIALAAYATGQHKPLIIDSHNLTQRYIANTSKTMETIATDDFAGYGTSYSTYKWPDSQSAGQFFELTDMSAIFLPINGMTAKANTWKKLNDSTYVARVLTIQNGAADNALTSKMQENLNMSSELVNPPDSLDPSFDTTKTYVLNSGAVLEKAYIGRYGTPTAVKFESIDISNTSNLTDLGDSTKYDLGKYDFIVVESGTKSISFNGYDASRAALVSAMYGNVHVLYSGSLVNTSGGSSSFENNANNYKYVYEKVATSNDKARFNFVLVSTRMKMSSYAKATTGRGVKDIADIINAGNFRSLNGNGSDESSNVYTALEIEPCYPINTTLANVFVDGSKSGGAKVRDLTDPLSKYTMATGSGTIQYKFSENAGTHRSSIPFGSQPGQYGDPGFYYLRSDGVLDATSDEISYNGTTSLTDMLESGDYNGSLTQDNAANIVDYYNWSLSKAKVAHALGVSYDEVRVVHMSSAEFAASKDTLLDSYDMIYFGGDTSAVTSDSYLYSIKNNMQFYRMYRHNGDTYKYPDNKNGSVANTTGVLTGNDITDDKLKELKEYVSKGMPVIFDKAVTKAYNSGADIDPDSNIYDFLNFASGKAYSENNALWNFDNDYTIKLANIGGSYGKTYSGYVTVFAQNAKVGYTDEKEDIVGVRTNRRGVGEDADTFLSTYLEDGVVGETDLGELIQKHQRPRLAVTSMPTMYVEGNKTTWIDYTDLTFKYKINGSEDAKATVYIDDDSNSRFTNDDPHKEGKDGTVTINLPKDYFGVVYWKLIAEEPDGRSASTTGVCKIKRKDQDKMVVDLLEIMPPMEAKENNNHTLCFCTECQQTKGILHSQRTADAKYSRDAVTSLSSGFHDIDNANFVESGDSYNYAQMVSKISADPYNVYDHNTNKTDVSDAVETDINNYVKYVNYNNKLGAHDHKFGIVKYYENLSMWEGGERRTGLDDWTTNWFDEIKDDYEVNLTLWTTREYEQACALVNKIYDGKDQAKTKAISAEFQTRKNEYYTYWHVMRELIEGHDNNSTYTTTKGETKHYIEASDWSKFYAYMTNSTTDPTNKGLGLTLEDINSYKVASQNIDNFLTSNTTFVEQIVRKNKTPEAYVLKEIAHETDNTIARSERNYYDLFSLWQPGDRNDFGTNLDEYCKLYQVWRNAKMLEIYFKNQYVKYSLLSSVNDKPTGNTVDTTKDNYVNLSGTFNCIVIGAAEDFDNDDINRTGCNALLDYINDDGNLILFHDTLNYNKGGTANMTTYLSDAFGQNARHLEYTNTDNTQVENIVNVKMAGKTKKVTFSPSDETVELTATAGTVQIAPSKVTLALTFRNGHPDESMDVTIDPDVTSADVCFITKNNWNNGSALDRYELRNVTRGDGTTAHSIALKIYFRAENNPGDPYNSTWKAKSEWGYPADITSAKILLNGAPATGVTEMDGETVSTTNGTMSGFSFGDETHTPYSGTEAEHPQYLRITYKDQDGNPIANESISATNRTDATTQTATTDASGLASFTYSNYSTNVTNSTGVRAKAGYKNSEYFISPTLNGNTPNTYILTPRAAFRDMQGHEGDIIMPYKYTIFIRNWEDAEFCIHCASDMRDQLHGGIRAVTDKTSQTNKGIVTMYPFTIGSSMKISNTTAQSYSLDIDDPNMTVYYTMAGGTSGTGSTMFAADPHNGQDNYFIYQYGAITYTGAGHSAITGLGRDNNDERRLFINCIVNSARKSTVGPELKLLDVDADLSRDKDGNPVRMSNDYVKPNGDGDADYKYEIEDITDQVDFSFLPSMAPGTEFSDVHIWFDISRDGSNKDTWQEDDDVEIFKSSRNDKVDSDILTRITTGRTGDDPINRMGIYLDTPDPGLTLDTSNIPNLVLKENYFDKSKKAYIVVKVTDNKGNEATKTIVVQYKPELLELN